MKTDNSNIVVESLEDAAKRIFPVSVQDLSPREKRKAFEMGANWQKEQLQSLVDSHKMLLENLIRIVDRVQENDWAEYIPSAYDRAKEAIEQASTQIEKANNITKTINI